MKRRRWISAGWTVCLLPFLFAPYRWLWLPCGLAVTLLLLPAGRPLREQLRVHGTLMVGAPLVLLLRTALDPGWWLTWMGTLPLLLTVRIRVPWMRGRALVATALAWPLAIVCLARPWGPNRWPRDGQVPPELVLVCAGDSLTSGVEHSTDAQTYVPRLRARLGCAVVNAGVGGDHTRDLIARLDGDVLAHRPDVVLVMIGGNDYLAGTPRRELADQLDEVLARIAASGARIVLVEMPSGIVWNPYAGLYRRAAARHGAILVPDSALRCLFITEFVARPWLRRPRTLDGVHLSPAGSDHVAAWLDPYVRAACLATG